MPHRELLTELQRLSFQAPASDEREMEYSYLEPKPPIVECCKRVNIPVEKIWRGGESRSEK